MESLKIIIQDLIEGRVEKISERLDPDFLAVTEQELSFSHPVEVKAEVYLVDPENLLCTFSATTIATMLCAICEQPILYEIKVAQESFLQELSQLPGLIFDLSDEVRTAILLQIPPFVECKGGCVLRKELWGYLEPKKQSDAVFYPFSDLDGESR